MRSRIILLTAIVLMGSAMSAQDSTKTKRIKEFYITLADFEPLEFHLKYKQEITKNFLFKIGLIDLSASVQENTPENTSRWPTSNTGYSGGLETGFEFRKSLGRRFSLYHGPNLGYTYSYSESRYLNPAVPESRQKNAIEQQRGTIPYTLGILFNITSNILISAEINPAISVTYTDVKMGERPQDNFTVTNAGFGFSSKLALVSLVYRP